MPWVVLILDNVTVYKDIWLWCINKQTWLTAAHVPETKIVEVDRESRLFSENKEWMLGPDIFHHITAIWAKPSIDFFASRLNHEVPSYAYWKPDPGVAVIDAFSIAWEKQFFYAFPPFSLTVRCIQKIQTDLAEGLMIVFMWPTKP